MAGEMFGHYRIEDLLGVGGMGEVHRAHDTVHDRAVALKRLTPAGDRADFRARFRHESRVLARLRDPHVTPVHAYGEIDGRPYLDMRLIDGRGLGELFRTEPMAPARAANILSQVAGALDAAHADGLVHRDVKPANVLVTANDFAYLIDFGIASSVSAESAVITRSNLVIGTMEYMAPERIRGARPDRRADVYSLACVLFECLTGRRPFLGRDPATLARAHVNLPPPAASLVQPGLPRALDAVIAKGMAKDPARRFGAASELLSEVTAVVAGTRVRQPPHDQRLTVPLPRPV